MNLVAYTRVSTSKQDVSHDVQAEGIKRWAEANGHEIVRVVTDTHSGKSNLRNSDDWQTVQSLIAGGADGVVVYKLDRLCRSVADFANLLADADYAVASVSEGIDMTTATGEMVANIIMSVAQWERRIIGERTKEALAVKKANGVQLGRPPVYPMPDADDCNHIKYLHGLGWGLKRIADHMEVSYSVVRRVMAT